MVRGFLFSARGNLDLSLDAAIIRIADTRVTWAKGLVQGRCGPGSTSYQIGKDTFVTSPDTKEILLVELFPRSLQWAVALPLPIELMRQVVDAGKGEGGRTALK